MIPVKITINSKTEGQSGPEQLQLIASGNLQEKAGTYYVRYEETEVTGLQGTRTTLKWTADALTIIRHGTYEHRQEHRAGLSYTSEYHTPYFTIALRTITRQLSIKGAANHWQLHIDYDLFLAEQENGKISLDILIEEEQSSEY